MKKHTLLKILLAVGMLGLPSLSLAAAFDPLPIGARATGMGGAYTAVANDAYSVYWNPAGLVGVKRPSVGFSHIDVQTLGLLSHDYFAYAQPFVFNNVVAISWARMGTTSNVTFMDYYAENTFTLSYQQPIVPELSVGANLKVMEVQFTNNGGGVGIDLGARFMAMPQLAVAMMAENINNPQITWVTRAEERLPQNLRLGLAGYVTPDWTLALDVDRMLEPLYQFHLGTEYWLFSHTLALRAGVTDLTAENKFLPSAGLSFRFSYFEFAYAYASHFDLDGNHVLSVQWGF